MATKMETYTGKLIDLSRPEPSDFCIEDIAWHLSHVSRFAGAPRSDTTYSVAQHSVLVMNRVKQTASEVTKPLLLSALLHDAHEAYMGDVSRPMSNLLDLRYPIQRLKDRLQKAIWLGLLGDIREAGKQLPQYAGALISDADNWALAYESYHLMHSAGKHYDHVEALDEEYILRNLIVWQPRYAYESFKNYFEDLLPNSSKQKSTMSAVG